MSIEGNRLGIVGGGQLGRMQTEAALPMGIDVSVVEKDLDCPAAQAGAKVILGDIKDAEAITKLAQSTDVVTWEIEHINTDILIQLREEHGIDVQPSPHSLKIVQDKHTQKQHFQKAGLPVADFRELDSKAAYEAALREWGRMMIKTRKGGFDGRGNMVVSSQGWRQVQQHFGNAELYAERMVDFEQELAIIVARDRLGNIESYPVVQTTHRDNICHLVEAPAPNLTVKKINEAHEIGRATVETLEGAGVFALELFDTGDSLIINEMAPRVHNSGHWTIEGSKTSQFEQHVRAVMGLPLGPAFMDNFTWKAVMINVLGEGKKPDGYRLTAKDLVAAYTAVPEIKVHLYGKGARLARKIGHITIPALFDNPDIVREKAELARNLIEV
jgi:phosphoribosylaminoimidazole carboxylase PurK protein